MTAVSFSALLHIGYVERAFGIKGGLKIKLFDPQSQSLQKGRTLIIFQDPSKKHQKPITISITSLVADGKILTNLTSRNEAEALVGAQVYVDRQELPVLEEDEFYLADVVGFEVHNLKGKVLGSIVGFSSNGAQHLVEIKKADSATVLIPFVKPLLVDIHHDQHVVIMDAPEELLI